MYCMRMLFSLQGFELDINGITLYVEICFFPQSALRLGNSFLLLHVAEVTAAGHFIV